MENNFGNLFFKFDSITYQFLSLPGRTFFLLLDNLMFADHFVVVLLTIFILTIILFLFNYLFLIFC